MSCELCDLGFKMIDGMHYDEGGFLECEGQAMLNKDEAQRANNELHRDAMKQEILEALKEGPAFPDALAKRLGGRSDQAFVRLLHEMLDDMEISFNWIRGYSV